MPYCFVIIDDSNNDIATLRDYLENAFRDGSAVVYDEKTSSWEVADDAVRSLPDNPEFVAFFDLSLRGSDVADASAGIEHVRALRVQRRQWTIIGYSRFMELGELMTQAEECFDGVISKQRLHPMKRDERIEYVKTIVEETVNRRHRRGIPVRSDAVFVDSFGMRVFRATFGEPALAELIYLEAVGWKAPRIATLTTGHSGAHLIEISSEGNKSIVVKVARSASIIEHELQAVTNNLSRLGAFVGKLAQLDPEMRTLNGGAVYYRQANVFGDPLLTLLASSSRRQAMQLIDKVATFSLETAKAYRPAMTKGVPRFSFTSVDRGRFESSVAFLIPMAKMLAKRGALDTAETELDRLGKRTLKLVEEWDSNPYVTKETFLVLQHGDFNPSNVLVTPSKDLVLIDLARFRDWPPGYDLARMALLLRLRLVDRGAYEDWLPFHMIRWAGERVAAITPGDRVSGSCHTAIRCDRLFQKFVEESPSEHRDHLRHGYQLGSMWDLIKVVSYQDASQFKRLWALFELDRLGQEIGAIPPSRTRVRGKTRRRHATSVRHL